MRKLFFTAALSLVGLTAMAQEETAELQADEITMETTAQDFEEISVSDLPEAVTSSVEKDYPTATVSKAYKNEADQYKLELSLEDGTSGTLYADAQGNWIEL
ncbi:MAG: hypothetical protein ABJN84_17310 [Flavobacteriaceae bacterium]